MLQLETLIADRLQAALPAGWAVKGDAGSTGDRRPGASGPVAVVAINGAQVSDARGTGVVLSPAWVVALAARRGPGAPALIDAALAAAVASLHNWQPGECAGRRWEPLQLAQVQAPQLADEGLTGLEITFTTAALYQGQP